MKRFLFALGLLATVTLSEADAGYVIIRLVLEGTNGGGQQGTPGMPGSPKSIDFNYKDGLLHPGSMSQNDTREKVDPHDPTQSIYVVVPFTKKPERRVFYTRLPFHQYQNPMWEAGLTHPFGSTNLLIDNTQIQWYMDHAEDPAVNRTRQSVVLDKHARWLKNPTEPQVLLDILTEALERGMVSEAVKYADELLAAVQEKKLPTTKQVDHFIQAYARIQKPLRDGVRHGTGGQVWKDRLLLAYPGAQDQPTPHYTLVYWDAPEADRLRRIGQLEDNFKAFFLLHAIQGIALPVPDRPLVAFLAKSGQDTVKLAHSLDGLPRVADAFYSPDHDVLVIAPERLDGIGQTFQRQVQQIYREGANRRDLLAGMGPVLDTSGTVEGRKKPEELARWMTWAMIDRYVEDEAEWAGISREASRQLLYATGLLPRHVTLPVWLTEGSADFYHRPKGPVHGVTGSDHKPIVTIALTTGYGVPNFVRQKQFKDLLENKEVSSDPGIFLRHVVGDAYFAAVRNGVDADDPKLPRRNAKPKHVGGSGAGKESGPVGGSRPPGGPGGGMGPGLMTGPGAEGSHAESESPGALRRRRHEFLVNKAYSTAWALYYYLARTDPDGLSRYLSELNRLPRDLPLDDTARVEVFARAFNLTDPTTFSAFGARWLDAMKTIPSAGIDIPLTDLDHHKDGGTPPQQPGQGSGGFPMPPRSRSGM